MAATDAFVGRGETIAGMDGGADLSGRVVVAEMADVGGEGVGE